MSALISIKCSRINCYRISNGGGVKVEWLAGAGVARAAAEGCIVGGDRGNCRHRRQPWAELRGDDAGVVPHAHTDHPQPSAAGHAASVAVTVA